MKFKLIGILGMCALSLTAHAAKRETINIVGSSTVYPFATVVAEDFGRETAFKTPKIESTGSGGGLKLFCDGIGLQTPDIANASRKIKKSEIKRCHNNGVDNISEVLIGFDGIAIANSVNAPLFNLTRLDLFLALAKEVPNPNGSKSLVKNPYKTWDQINSSLPKIKIEVLGPPPTSGTRDAFVELVMEKGAKEISWFKQITKGEFIQITHNIRSDGAYIEAGENDNLIVQKLEKNPDLLGIFGYSFLEQNTDKVQGSKIEGKQPNFASIATGEYKVSRPLYFYVKNAHLGKIPGLKDYVAKFISDDAIGQDGYLVDKGLIPLAPTKLEKMRKDVTSKAELTF